MQATGSPFCSGACVQRHSGKARLQYQGQAFSTCLYVVSGLLDGSPYQRWDNTSCQHAPETMGSKDAMNERGEVRSQEVLGTCR